MFPKELVTRKSELPYSSDVFAEINSSIPIPEELVGKACVMSTDDDTYYLLADPSIQHQPSILNILQDLDDVAKKVNPISVDSTVIRAVREETLQRVSSTSDDSDSIDLFNRIVSSAIELRASDIMLVREGLDAQIYFMINDRKVLQDSVRMNASELTDMASVAYSYLADGSKGYFSETKELDTSILFRNEGLSYAVRYNSRGTKNGGMLITLRVEGKKVAGESSKDIPIIQRFINNGYDEDQAKLLIRMLESSSGLILVTGETGSGKTVLLALMLEALGDDNEGMHILSLEAPAELDIRTVTQMNVEESMEEDFPGMLRKMPHAIMVGEVRTPGEMKATLSGALTGHLTFATMHTNSGNETVARCRDLGMPKDSLATSLVGVINQVLLSRLCDNCKVPIEQANLKGLVRPDVYRRVKHNFPDEMSNICVASKHGCDKCLNSGVSGRTPAIEIINPDKEFLRLHALGESLAAGEHWRNKKGKTINPWVGKDTKDHAIEKMLQGLVDPSHVERKTSRFFDPLDDLGMKSPAEKENLDVKKPITPIKPQDFKSLDSALSAMDASNLETSSIHEVGTTLNLSSDNDSKAPDSEGGNIDVV